MLLLGTVHDLGLDASENVGVVTDEPLHVTVSIVNSFEFSLVLSFLGYSLKQIDVSLVILANLDSAWVFLNFPA